MPTARAADVRAREQDLERAAKDVARLEAGARVGAVRPRELQACEDGRDLARELADDRAEAPEAEMRVRAATSALDGGRSHRGGRGRAPRRGTRLAARAPRRDGSRPCAPSPQAQDAHRAMTLRSHLAPGTPVPCASSTWPSCRPSSWRRSSPRCSRRRTRRSMPAARWKRASPSSRRRTRARPPRPKARVVTLAAARAVARGSADARHRQHHPPRRRARPLPAGLRSRDARALAARAAGHAARSPDAARDAANGSCEIAQRHARRRRASRGPGATGPRRLPSRGRSGRRAVGDQAGRA